MLSSEHSLPCYRTHIPKTYSIRIHHSLCLRQVIWALLAAESRIRCQLVQFGEVRSTPTAATRKSCLLELTAEPGGPGGPTPPLGGKCVHRHPKWCGCDRKLSHTLQSCSATYGTASQIDGSTRLIARPFSSTRTDCCRIRRTSNVMRQGLQRRLAVKRCRSRTFEE